jgi:[acyl-carrier-protein] S-malonyltransferase
MKAYVFPGQGAQFTGMGKDIFESSSDAAALFRKADDILGFKLTDVMFHGTADEQKQTRVTQPAIFLHSVALALTNETFKPDMVAGHSLGELSALVANKALSFEDGLKLVFKRAIAMQHACEINPSTMAAIIGLDDKVVEDICASIDDVVVPANYNCPGQLVISGTIRGIDIACEKLKAAGARRALPLQVGGAFHSPLMEPAREELATAIDPGTLTLGDGADPDTPVAQRNNGTLMAEVDDVNEDGLPDLLVHFRVPALVANGDLTPATISLMLRGFLEDGCTNILGEDEVTVVP